MTAYRKTARSLRRSIGRGFVAERLEGRQLLASLVDLVGLAPAAPANSATAAAAGSGSGSDSRANLVWLANHVDVPTLHTLDKAGGELQSMYAQALRDGKDHTRVTVHNTRPADVYLTNDTGPMVSIGTADAAGLAARLAGLGFEVAGQFDSDGAGPVRGLVDVYTPLARIAELAGVDGVRSMNAQVQPQWSAQGTAANQWETLGGFPRARQLDPSSDGSGVDYGIIGQSFNRVPGPGGRNLAFSQNTGNLPDNSRITLLDDSFVGNGDEGRAMAELIYDVAPASDFVFHTGGGGIANFAGAIDELRQAGADVIVDDGRYLSEPAFQDGVIAQAVDAVVNTHKVPYFAAAGNFNGETYLSTFNEVDGGPGFGRNHFFEDGTPYLNCSVPSGQTLTVGLHWANPLGGTTRDLDLKIRDGSDPISVLASNTTSEIGGDPYTQLSFSHNGGGTRQVLIQVVNFTAGSATGLPIFLDMSLSGDGVGIGNDGLTTNEPSITGHANADRAFSVGAVDIANPNAVRSYSGRGGVPIRFDAAGAPVNVTRSSPDAVAADGVANSFFGTQFGTDFVFSGTSAAAANAAAVAGLMFEAADRTPLGFDTYRTALIDPAFDIAPAGFDNISGRGRVDAVVPIVGAEAFTDIDTWLELNQFGDGFVREVISGNNDRASVGYAFDPAAASSNYNVNIANNYNATMTFGALGGGDSQVFAVFRESSGFNGPLGPSSPAIRLFHTVYPTTSLGAQANGASDFTINGPNANVQSQNLTAEGTRAITDTISHGVDTDYFSFTTPVDLNGPVQFAAKVSSGLDAVLSIYDPAGALVVRADSGGNNLAERFSQALLPNTTYVLRVGSFRGTSAGAYDIRIRAPRPLKGGLTNGTPTFNATSVIVPSGANAASLNNAVGAVLPIVNGADVGYFFGHDPQLNGAQVTIDVASTAFDTVIGVYAFNDFFSGGQPELVAFDDDGGPGANSQITFVPQPGVRHVLAVTSFAADGGGGAYEIDVNYGGTPTSDLVTLGAAGAGNALVDLANLPANGDARTFRFVAPPDTDNAGHRFSFFTQNGNADLYVFDNAGNLLGGNSNGGTGNEEIVLGSQIVAGQTYHVTVIPELYAAPVAAAQVDINLNTVPGVPGAPDLLAGDDTGASDADNVTRTNTNLSFQIPSEEAVFVRLLRNGVVVAGPTESGTFGIQLDDPTPLADGTYSYTATVANSPTGIQSPPTAAASVTVDTAAPRVSGVFASGSGWTAAYRSALAALGLGTAAAGYRVPAGANQLSDLPWSNLDRLSVGFNEDVAVSRDHLSVRGVSVAGGTYAYAAGAAGFAYDPAARVATWGLSATVGVDKLRLVLAGTGGAPVADPAGNVLDGEWTDSAAAFPSGNGTAGGDFRFRLDVLPGNIDGAGSVNLADFGRLRSGFGQALTATSIFADLIGDGAVNLADFGVLRSRFGQSLPAGDPA